MTTATSTPMHQVPTSFSPLSGWDEYPIHQIVAPVRFVQTTDPRAFERYWFTAQPKDGRFMAVIGMGFYPNLKVADAYALLVHKGRQVTVRAQRSMTADRADMRVGPISLDPSRPFAEWNLRVDDNAQGLRCDLIWRDTKRAVFRKMDVSKLPGMPENVHLLHDWGGYETFGAVEGWIEYDGERLELVAGECSGSRDHHWGMRDGVGGLNIASPNPNRSHCGQWVEFADWALWGDQVLYGIGALTTQPASATAIEHRCAFHADTRHFKEAIVTNRLANGELRTLHFKEVPGVTAYLRCAGYTGRDGRGTPDGNHHHGQDLGGEVSGEVFDVSNAAVRQSIAGFEDHLCIVECNGETTIGIFECCNPALYHMCARGAAGYSILEPG